jgi:hypothetical protein
MATNVREATVEFIDDVIKYFLIDFDALSEEQILNSPGGAARKPIDFVHECSLIHKFIVCRLNGTDPSGVMADQKRDENNFITAPAGLTKDAAREDFKTSLEALRKMVVDASDENLLRPVKTSNGEEPFYSLAMFAAIHSNYHNAQLAQIQGLNGDGSNHWF